jgi:hypothetical protein
VIADAELGKFGGEVYRVASKKVPMNTIKRSIDLKHFMRQGIYMAVVRKITHQECDISIVEKIFVMLRI